MSLLINKLIMRKNQALTQQPKLNSGAKLEESKVPDATQSDELSLKDLVEEVCRVDKSLARITLEDLLDVLIDGSLSPTVVGQPVNTSDLSSSIVANAKPD